ncbi:hypothetical protein Glo7428_0662 [Gloeocapsa sp. PCC 7428]|nr:hypothetical protein Glo7428_0662 [Gloeocapsa sp. PCC 7428]
MQRLPKQSVNFEFDSTVSANIFTDNEFDQLGDQEVANCLAASSKYSK